MKKKDYIILLSLIAIIAISFIISYLTNRTSPTYVEVISDGEVLGDYSLNKDRTIVFDKNTLVIKDGNVSLINCDCKDHLCEKQGQISKSGQSIVCLPNKFTVKICSPDDPISASGFKLGTLVTITIYDVPDSSLLDECLDICDQYEAICSRTSEDSELYKLNHRLTSCNNNGEYQVSEELYNMIDQGLKYSKASDGTFDITIGALSELWNFTGSNEEYVPTDNEISTALSTVGYEKVHLKEGNLISFDSEDTMLDLGGFAKGYIADRICDYLKNQGVNEAIISLGGDTLCIGGDYNIGIQKPYATEGDVAVTVQVSDKAVVTSGTYERYFVKDGITYHHILDTSTGYPADSDMCSVSTICDSASDGDFYATYIFCLGSEAGNSYATDNNIGTILMDNDGNIIGD